MRSSVQAAIKTVVSPADFLRSLAEQALNKTFYPDAQFVAFFREGDIKPLAGFVFENFTGDQEGKINACMFHVYIHDKRAVSRPMLREATRYPFEILKVKRLWATIDADNAGSIRIAKGVGAVREGVLRKAGTSGQDAYLYACLNGEYKYGG